MNSSDVGLKVREAVLDSSLLAVTAAESGKKPSVKIPLSPTFPPSQDLKPVEDKKPKRWSFQEVLPRKTSSSNLTKDEKDKKRATSDPITPGLEIDLNPLKKRQSRDKTKKTSSSNLSSPPKRDESSSQKIKRKTSSLSPSKKSDPAIQKIKVATPQIAISQITDSHSPLENDESKSRELSSKVSQIERKPVCSKPVIDEAQEIIIQRTKDLLDSPRLGTPEVQKELICMMLSSDTTYKLLHLHCKKKYTEEHVEFLFDYFKWTQKNQDNSDSISYRDLGNIVKIYIGQEKEKGINIPWESIAEISGCFENQDFPKVQQLLRQVNELVISLLWQNVFSYVFEDPNTKNEILKSLS